MRYVNAERQRQLGSRTVRVHHGTLAVGVALVSRGPLFVPWCAQHVSVDRTGIALESHPQQRYKWYRISSIHATYAFSYMAERCAGLLTGNMRLGVDVVFRSKFHVRINEVSIVAVAQCTLVLFKLFPVTLNKKAMVCLPSVFSGRHKIAKERIVPLQYIWRPEKCFIEELHESCLSFRSPCGTKETCFFIRTNVCVYHLSQWTQGQLTDI